MGDENIVGLAVVLVVVAIGLVFFDFSSLNFDGEEVSVNGGSVIDGINGENGKSVGGDRDVHGCLGSAGYSWSESELSCVREWETGVKRYQVIDFVSCADAGYAVMESYPRQCRAPNGNVFVENV